MTLTTGKQSFKMWCYVTSRSRELGTFRPMTLSEVLALRYGDHIWFTSTSDDARRLKVNGAVRRWKRSPSRFALPCKYGMYEHHTFTNDDLARLLVRLA